MGAGARHTQRCQGAAAFVRGMNIVGVFKVVLSLAYDVPNGSLLIVRERTGMGALDVMRWKARRAQRDRSVRVKTNKAIASRRGGGRKEPGQQHKERGTGKDGARAEENYHYSVV